MTHQAASDALAERLRAHALASYPEVHLVSPWPGHLDLAVRGKTFAYLRPRGAPFRIACKLPQSNALALMLPHVEPAGYGLAKSGWVSLEPPVGELPDEAMLLAWLDESYRAQAPRTLVKRLDAGASAALTSSPQAPQKAPTKRRSR